MRHLTAPDSLVDTSGWKGRHDSAVKAPEPGPERALIGMLRGWGEYADWYRTKYLGLRLGDDRILGVPWAKMGDHLRSLLNGDIGRLDASVLDAWICQTLLDNGRDPNV